MANRDEQTKRFVIRVEVAEAQGKALWTGHIILGGEGRFDKMGELGATFGRLMFETFLRDYACPADGGRYEIHDGAEESFADALVRGMVTGVTEIGGVPVRVVVADADGTFTIPATEESGAEDEEVGA
jgi:hypothetical protein